MGDVGAAAWQLVPAAKFMADVFRTGSSPYWNPYQAMGAYGPETLVDVKFSVITVAMAAFGASTAAQTFVLLFVFAAGMFFMTRLLIRFFHASLPAALAGSVVFLLNGFALANLNNQIGQPYFIAPVVLYALLNLHASPSRAGFVWAVVAHVAALSITFFPTLVLTLILVHVCALAFLFTRDSGATASSRNLVLLQCAAPVLAALILAFLYLPSVEALTHTRTAGEYNRRLTPGISIRSFFSLFSPKHFWESYRAMQMPPDAPPGGYEMFVFHLGVTASLIGSQGIFRRHRLVGLSCLALLVAGVGQIFGIPPFTALDFLPFFSFVRNDYWAALVSLAAALLVGLGFDSFRFGAGAKIALACAATAIGGSFAFLLGRLGGVPAQGYAGFYVNWFAFFFATGFAVLLWSRLRPSRIGAWVLFALVFFEGMFYQNSLRPLRVDRDEQLAPALAWVRDRVAAENGRVLNIGRNGIFPNLSANLRISEIGNLNAMPFPWYWDFYHKYVGLGLFDSLAAGDVFLYTRNSLTVAGVNYVVVDRRSEEAVNRLKTQGFEQAAQDELRFVFRNPDRISRVTLAEAVVPSDHLPHELGCAFPATATTANLALIEEAKRLNIATEKYGPMSPAQPPGSVRVTSYRNADVRLEGNLTRPALLVFADAWHPGWHASVDGKPVDVHRVNIAFRGIPLTAGNHTIEMWYAPASLFPGIVISLIALAATGLIAIPGTVWARLPVRLPWTSRRSPEAV